MKTPTSNRTADVAEHARDVGRTSGGGSLGHVQPDDVTREAPIRNQAEKRPSERDDAFDQDEDPVMPANDSTLNTKI
jgi:hypothetical protein